MTSKIQAALDYAARGWAVFPCRADTKMPATSNGFKDATTDPALIERWFAGDANLAIRTGNGLVVVDVDDPASMLVTALPSTLAARTPRGGWHFYFSVKGEMRNTAGKLAAHVDTRADGGYVVAPPSTINGAAYRWANDLPIAPLPDAIITALTAGQPRPRPQTQAVQVFTARTSTYGAKALSEECDKVRNAVEGTRNAELNRAAFRVAQLVAGGQVDEGEARAHMIDAALAAGLGERETEKTIDSAFRGGLANPRTPAPRPDPLGGMDVYASVPDDNPLADVVAKQQSEDAAQWQALDNVMALGGICEHFPAWVLENARYQQPAMTLCALLALGAGIAQRRFVFRGLTSSALFVVLAKSGEGKDLPQKLTGELLAKHWSHVAGPSDLSSTVSTIERISEATEKGVGTLMVLDEYGPRLKTLLDPRGHQKEMRSLLLTLATIGTGTYHHAASLARGGTSGDRVMHAPGLTVYGSSTPDAFHDAVGRLAVEDGFLGRHLFFPALNRLPRRRDVVRTAPPPELEEAIRIIRERHEEWHKSQPREGVSDDGRPLLIYRPIHVEADDDGARLLDEYADACDERRRDPAQDDDVPAALLARAAEHATRLALVLAVLRAPDRQPVVDAACARLAVEVASSCLRALASSLATGAARSDFQRARLEISAALIRAGGTLSAGDLCARVPWVKTQDIQDVMKRLAFEGAVGQSQSENGSVIYFVKKQADSA